MNYEKTKTIMKKSNKEEKEFGIDYYMNIYKGCSFGCIYCKSRSNLYHNGDFNEIKSKENILNILEHELSTKQFKGVVSLGSLSDPYNNQEKKLKLTRKVLELILKYGFGVSIETKSDLIIRDIDLLQKISKNNNVIVKISITTPSDKLAKILEPNVISSTKRFKLVKTLNKNGIYTGINVMPILPFLTDNENDLKRLIELAYINNAKFVYTDFELHLRSKVKDYFYDKLSTNYLAIVKDYKMYFKNTSICEPLEKEKLVNFFASTCKNYQLLYKKSDIVKDFKKIKPTTNTQISLFS